MRKYELILLIKPEKSEMADDVLKPYCDIVTKNGGTVDKLEHLGRKQLAFAVAKYHKAHYTHMLITVDETTRAALEAAFKHSDVIRHMFIRMDEKPNSKVDPKLHVLNTEYLRKYLNSLFQINASRLTGLSRRDQRALTIAVKRARTLSLLAYSDAHKE